jgi:hypothetical protein
MNSILDDTAVVFSCDENFFGLAKGLVLSLRQPGDLSPKNIHFLDIGASHDSLQWLEAQGVRVLGDVKKFCLPEQVSEVGRNYRVAQLLRPDLPRIITGYDYYMWIDSDVWLQDLSSLKVFRRAAEAKNGAAVVVPTIDCTYGILLEDCTRFTKYAQGWYEPLYGPAIANEFSRKTIFNSGMFCMAASSQLWDAWRHELSKVRYGEIKNDFSKHLAEQTCFNYLLHTTKNYSVLDATYNYNLHLGYARRNQRTGKVTTIQEIERDILVVRLTYSSKLISRYLNEGLLYGAGNYLLESERQTLLQL